MYYYESEIGLLWIVLLKDRRWYFKFEGNYYGPYYSAIAAADDVMTHSTGCNKWDNSYGTGISYPQDLSEWLRGKPDGV